MLTEQLDWEKTDGMMPAIVQHAVSGEVLMHGYMNKEALEKTEATGKVTFYSRTKQQCSIVPAPPEAISGTWHTARTFASCCRS